MSQLTMGDSVKVNGRRHAILRGRFAPTVRSPGLEKDFWGGNGLARWDLVPSIMLKERGQGHTNSSSQIISHTNRSLLPRSAGKVSSQKEFWTDSETQLHRSQLGLSS